MKIKCTVCNKEFYYGDHNSPMFIDEVWNKIINYFKLTNFEKEAAKKFSSYYKGEVKILLKGKYQRGTYLHPWRKLTIGV